ncbi:MAG TPA: hypothetical protein DCQ06_04540, partial [Myxococcales bacterium]|nr:hypothetical protein [Myxococcales bacterium]
MLTMRSIALVVTLCWCPTMLWAAPPPTRIDLDSEHSRPNIADEPRPKAGSKLPSIEVVRQPKPELKPKPKAAIQQQPPKRRVAVKMATKEPGFRVQVDFGWITVPRSLVTFAAQVNQFPDLGAYTLDVSVLRTGRGHHDFGGRLGLTFPQVPAANWYLSTEGAKRPVYTEVDLVGVDLAFTYQYRRLILGPLGINLRAGAGLTIAAG